MGGDDSPRSLAVVYIWRVLPQRSRTYRGLLLPEQHRTARVAVRGHGEKSIVLVARQ